MFLSLHWTYSQQSNPISSSSIISQNKSSFHSHAFLLPNLNHFTISRPQASPPVPTHQWTKNYVQYQQHTWDWSHLISDTHKGLPRRKRNLSHSVPNVLQSVLPVFFSDVIFPQGFHICKTYVLCLSFFIIGRDNNSPSFTRILKD